MKYFKIFAPYDFHMDGLYEIDCELPFMTQEAWDWFETQFGNGENRYDGRWMTNPATEEIDGMYRHGREFFFRDEKDVMLFKLTWL